MGIKFFWNYKSLFFNNFFFLKRYPNEKSFLFGEINQILESRKPTEEDKKKINDEFGEYLKSENENLIQLSNDELGKQLARVFTEDNIAG